MQKKKILLSFDIEEFDTPLEYGRKIPLEEQFQYSRDGLSEILSLLEKQYLPATFFTTANFALRFPRLIKEMSEKYEIASHGYYHSSFSSLDLTTSKAALEKITGKSIAGFRMARMMPIDDNEIEKSGYLYNASLHPTFIPGRYNNFTKPRTPFITGSLVQIPASVTPFLRFPIFWLSFKNFPLTVIKQATRQIVKKDGFANFYFHPWEFTDIRDKKKLGLPFYISRLSGKDMVDRLNRFITWCKAEGFQFDTYMSMVEKVLKQGNGQEDS